MVEYIMGINSDRIIKIITSPGIIIEILPEYNDGLEFVYKNRRTIRTIPIILLIILNLFLLILYNNSFNKLIKINKNIDTVNTL